MTFETTIFKDGEEIPVTVEATIEYDPGERIERGHPYNGRGKGYYVSHIVVTGVSSLSREEMRKLEDEALSRKDDHRDIGCDDGDVEESRTWNRSMFLLDKALPDIMEDDTVEQDARQIEREVEQYLGDVIDPDMDEASAKEECWTLCIDKANDLFGQGPRAIAAAKTACTTFGYGDEKPNRPSATPVWPPQPFKEGQESDGNEDIDATNQTLENFLASPEAKEYHLFDMEAVNYACEELKTVLKPGFGLALNGYAYYPNKTFTKWTASDGSVIRMPMAQFLWAYAGKNLFMDLMTAEPEGLDHFIVKKRKGQEDYEGGVMRGDHY